jgi:hypothetical protein
MGWDMLTAFWQLTTPCARLALVSLLRSGLRAEYPDKL